MGKRTEHAPGTFSWIDLATSDPEGAKSFYGSLFGWEFDDAPVSEGVIYTMCSVQGESVCGLNAQQEQEREAGIPPHWNNYVTVVDVDAATVKAGDAGGNVLAGPFDVMEAGRMSVIQDPTGGAVCLWQAGENIGVGIVNVPGALTWNELHTGDIETATRFYSELFGWEFEGMEDPKGEMVYWVIRNGDRSNGGIMHTQPGEPPNWMPYLVAEDLEEALATVIEQGGQTIAGPIDVPNGRFAAAQDPQGAMFALLVGELDD